MEQLLGRLVRNLDCTERMIGTRIKTLLHLHEADASEFVAIEDGALNRCSPTPAR